MKNNPHEIEATLRLMEMSTDVPTKLPDAVRVFEETLKSVRLALTSTPEAVDKPFVDPKASVFDDYIICLEDGVKVRMLRSYLRRFNLTPEAYRKRWNLPLEYPMVPPSFSRRRAEISKQTQIKIRRAQRNG